MTLKKQIMVLIVVGATGLAVGRFTVPTKTVIETKIVEVQKKSEKTDTKLNKTTKKKTTITETKNKDGSSSTTTVIDVATGVDKDSTTVQKEDSSKSNERSKTVVKDSGHLNLSVLAGVNPFNLSSQPQMIYGGHITRDILGPLNIGVWGLSNGNVGLSAGLTF